MREIFTNIYSYKKFIIHIYRLKKEKKFIFQTLPIHKFPILIAHIKTTFTFQILNKQHTLQIILKNTNKLLHYCYTKTFKLLSNIFKLSLTNND